MCAPHCPTPSPTPSAAPSVPQSPGTAPGAPIGRTAPAGRIYLTSAGNIAYTYADGGFWMYWFERTCPQWKPTALLAERYARENRGPEMRSPDQWLAEYAAGHDFKEITQKEFDTMCETGIAPSGDAAATTGGTAALEPQQEEIQTTTADADGESGRLCPVDASAPVTGGPTTPDLAEAATGQAMPSFDYSGLDEQTVADLHLAEREYASGKRLVETGLRRMADGVAIAHDALCGRARPNLGRAQNNQYSEDTFRRWCESMQISKTAAYRLLQVSRLMESSSPKEEKVLEQLAPSLLYEVSKPSAPAELVQAVKDGEITTHKEYQALLAQLKAERERADNAEERAQGAERQLEAAQADVAAVLERAQAAQRSAELDAKELQRLDKLTAHYKAEKTARIQELEARPVEVTGATEKEIARWKAEGAKAERDKAQKERDKAAVREAALRKELTDLREDNEQVSTEMLALQSELCELRRQTDQGQGDPAAPPAPQPLAPASDAPPDALLPAPALASAELYPGESLADYPPPGQRPQQPPEDGLDRLIEETAADDLPF